VNRKPHIAARILRRLTRQEGFALVLSLGATTVLTIIGASAALYSTQSYGVASRSKADQAAYTLAEAGINNAMSVLSTAPNPLNPSLLPQRTSTYDSGTVTWVGTLNEATGVWALSSTGTMRNPTGPDAAPVQRRVTASVPVNAAPAQRLTNQSWNYVYARQKGLTCDMTVGNSVQVNSPLYVNGNLCLNNTATIARGPLVVNGMLTLTQSTNAVGSAASAISEAHVAGGCKWYTNAAHNPCQAGAGTAGKDNVWAGVLDAVPGTITAPAPDWSTWYLNASPGPYYPCAVVSGTPPVFDNDQGARTSPDPTKRNDSLNSGTATDLTPATSYTCKTDAGELSWDATTRTLTVNGTVYIDGSAKVANGLVNSYVGQGALYLSGTFLMKNSKLCAVVTTDGATCTTAGWTPDSRLLVIVAFGTGSWGGAAAQVAAGDTIQLISSYGQFAAYGQYAVDLDTTSRVDGPLDGSTVKLGQSTSSSFPSISIVPVGMPGNPVVYGTLGQLGGYAG
jgi:hypothetical protein